jgi:diaminohydroxyphosphoribosylaminopyrimidine deaminase / 5-amino-6-(5-phosphoribosylamino)uracil reductase
MTGATTDATELWALLRALVSFRASVAAGSPTVVSVMLHAGRGAEAIAGDHPEAALVCPSVGPIESRRELQADARELFELYAPLCRPAFAGPSSPSAYGSFVVAHLGQSLDGRIAPPNGKPEAITGLADVTHNHRMRALFDVCLVGAGTVCHDNPALTVRHVEGENPVRVVIDPERRLSVDHSLFKDGLAPTLLVCRSEHRARGDRHGLAEIVCVDSECSPSAVLEALRERGLRRIFIEGGGVTVSRFLLASCLHRLQIAVSPFILGQGRPGIDVGQTLRLRPRVRRFNLAEDVLFECCFDDD